MDRYQTDNKKMNFQGHKTKEQWKKHFAAKEVKETKARAKALLAEKEKKSPRRISARVKAREETA